MSEVVDEFQVQRDLFLTKNKALFCPFFGQKPCFNCPFLKSMRTNKHTIAMIFLRLTKHQIGLCSMGICEDVFKKNKKTRKSTGLPIGKKLKKIEKVGYLRKWTFFLIKKDSKLKKRHFEN